MRDVLAEICACKREHVKGCKERRPLSAVLKAAEKAAPPRGFYAALANAVASGGYGLVAEIKRASPSAGVIRSDFDPVALARAYEKGGATCLSVLTDAEYFQGSGADLTAARTATGLPVLHKDFVIDVYQIAEARALGADCVLLIMAALGDGLARELEGAAMAYGMDVLIEVHDGAELERASKLAAPLIGVNNRDLKTLKIDLSTTERLARRVPQGRLVVSESGLNGPDDLARMAKAGASCFLIGEALMREKDVEAATRNLLGRMAPPQMAGRARA